jgi:hypothetical protein
MLQPSHCVTVPAPECNALHGPCLQSAAHEYPGNFVYCALQEQQQAAGAAEQAAAEPEGKKKSNIVTNWGQAAGHKASLAAGQSSKPNAAAGEVQYAPPTTVITACMQTTEHALG